MAKIKKALSFTTHTSLRSCRVLKKLLWSEQSLTEGDNITLWDTLDQLHHEESLVSALDVKILESLTNDDKVEAKVLQTEEFNSLSTTAKVKITHCLTPLAASLPLWPIHTTQNSERAVVDTNRPLSGMQKWVTSELNFKEKHMM